MIVGLGSIGCLFVQLLKRAGAAVVGCDTLVDRGAVHCFTGGGDTLPLSLDRLYRRELTISATYSSSPADLAEAFRLIAGDAIEVECLGTHRVPLESLASGVELMRRREALKVYVTP
jgi:threonine dehydrogenase-like Zn-dependent dehydrogenase